MAFPGGIEQLAPSITDDDQPPEQSLHNNNEEPPHDLDERRFRRVNFLIHHKNFPDLLKMALDQPSSPINLMGDPLLSVIIASGEYFTGLALQLIEGLGEDKLEFKNFYGDTALHVAASANAIKVAHALVKKNSKLASSTNNKQETALHKAALNGHIDMFLYLVKERESEPLSRTKDGSNMLHCAIMGNTPVLALKIARRYPSLIYTRNEQAETPLQLMVAIPDLFRSQLPLGPVESFLYDWIPLEEERKESKGSDEESSKVGDGAEDDVEDVYDISDWSRNIRPKFPPQYGIIFDLLEFILRQMFAWFLPSLFSILKLFSETLNKLEKDKRKHKQALDLVGYFAIDAKEKKSFDFYCKGYTGGRRDRDGPGISESDRGEADQDQSKRQMLYQFADKLFRFLSVKESEPESASKEMVSSMKKVLEEMTGKTDIRWHESPLITGTKMGLDDLVIRILHDCPQSATYLDEDGRSVLETGIKYGRREIVKTINKMTRGSNPILPSWLKSRVDVNTGNTILHFASEKSEAEGDAVQLQDEIKWFETVKDIVPKELQNQRNEGEKTAQELFSEKHEAMVRNCKTQLIEMGKTCASLVAAVVFASSFSIPGEKNPNTGNPLYFDRLPFKIFSHAYVIGFACAATSLVLFLSLVITPYRESDFRRAVPMKYFLACLSFAMALLAFFISFTCNIFLQIYGGQRTETRDLMTLLLELTIFPAVCFIALLYSGARFGPSFSRLWATV